ncbi:hypothetical protein BKA65DRAFT_41316 [Rhexocercosporidium sp. MPI-PUGE-AT-0058]|nr:hypothetical protein BKA65DRAFT_41316 [Rhexocercosporidium sp. MPI-PUGE-AT-0058]
MEQRESLSLIPPPLGVTSNFENPEYIGDVVIVSNLVLLVLSTLLFFTRIYTRRMVVHSVDFGDYALAMGWFLSLGFFVSCVVCELRDLLFSMMILNFGLSSVGTRHGLGIHAWDMPVAGFSLFSKMGIIAGAFYAMSTLSIKLSILSFYLRISPCRKFRICVYGLAVLTMAYCLAQTLEFTYSCRPMAKAWDLSITTGSCSGALEMCVTNSAANAAVDIAMLILPIAMLWNVRIVKRDKIGVVAILMTGSLVCIVSVIRLRAHVSILSDHDGTWITAKVVQWNAVEVHVGVICACLPHLKPLLRWHFPKVFESSSQGGTPMELPSLESFSQHCIKEENRVEKK